MASRVGIRGVDYVFPCRFVSGTFLPPHPQIKNNSRDDWGNNSSVEYITDVFGTGAKLFSFNHIHYTFLSLYEIKSKTVCCFKSLQL